MSTDIHVELGDSIEEHRCECCGRAVRSGRGWVLEGDDITVSYWFDAHQGDEERAARLLVVFETPRRPPRFNRRESYVVHGRPAPGGLAFSLADRAGSPFIPDRRVTGRTLDRRRALRSRRLPDLWRIVETVVDRDPALAAVFGAT